MPIDTSRASADARHASRLPGGRRGPLARARAGVAAVARAADPRLRRRAARRPGTLAGAATDAGLDPASLSAGARSEDVTAAVEEDKALARRADAGRARARPQARQLVRRAALYVPELRDRARHRRRSDRRARLSVLQRLRRDPGQPRARPRASRAARVGWRRCCAGPGSRWPPRRSPCCAGIEVADAREALGRVATERHVGADGFWSLRPLSSIAICSRMSRPSWAPPSMPVREDHVADLLRVDLGQHRQRRAPVVLLERAGHDAPQPASGMRLRRSRC